MGKIHGLLITVFLSTLVLLVQAAPTIHFPDPGAGERRIDATADGFVPLLVIAEQAGADLEWDPVARRLELSRGERTVALVIGQPMLLLGKRRVRMMARAPRLAQGEPFLPDEALGPLFGELARPGESWSVQGGLARPPEIRVPDGPRETARPTNVPFEPPESGRRIEVVILDPGHGGRDPGAVGHGGIHESRIVMQITERVARRLRAAKPDFHLILTRSDNRTVSLEERAEIANEVVRKRQRGVFVSIHANASLSPARAGFETYYLSPIPSNEEARATSAIENGALETEGRVPSGALMDSILSQMLVEEYRRESIQLADLIQGNLARQIGRYSANRSVRKANFFVMRSVLMPSVLVEAGFVTNPREAGLLVTADYQEKVAAGIADGILNFVRSFSRKQ